MKKVKKVMAVALIMTILFVVPVYASSATFYPGGYPTDCELYFENLNMDAVSTMDSSFEAEMEIDGIAYSIIGGYYLKAYSEQTYGIKATRHCEYGFDEAEVEYKLWTYEGDYDCITLYE